MLSHTMEYTWKPEITGDPMEFLSRSWSSSAVQVSKALLASTPADGGPEAIPEETGANPEEEPSAARNPFSFASSATSQLVLERIMSQSQEVSPLTSGRLSHSSGPLNGGGSLSDSPPVSPSDLDEIKLCRAINTPRPQYNGGSRTVGRWLKDRRERKKEESRAHNAQLHAAVSVAGVAAAVAAVASASAGKGGGASASRTDLAVASAATLVAAQCVEAAEAMGADRDHLAAVVGSAVSVRNSGDIATLTAAAATALRGAATLKARVLKEAWNLAAVIPVEKGSTMTQNRQILKNHKNADPDDLSGELVNKNPVGICTLELLARGTELLKRTRKGALHWKMVSVYIHRSGVVMLKMKSRHVAGTITKKKKSVVTAVCEDIAAWPGRHLSEGEELRRYFGLRTANRRVTEFECRGRSEYEMFTNGVVRLLEIVANGKQLVR